MGLTKVILSHKRHDVIITHKAVANCVVCIPESQLGPYKENHPDLEYVLHPDSVKGISPKRQWAYEKFGDIFMFDDDITRLGRVYEGKDNLRPTKLTPEEASDLIDDVYEMAKEAGAYLFGFNRAANPLAYHGSSPFKLSEFIPSGGVGVRKSPHIHFPDYWDFVGEDYFLNGINAYYHRYCFVDYRFAFAFKDTEHGVGGVADFRTEQRRKETYIFLKKQFGDAISFKIPTTIKPNIMKWEKTLRIPW